MINRRELATWVAQGRRCLQETRPSPSYLESHMIGLRCLRSDPEANSLYVQIEARVEGARIRWKRQKP